MKKIPLYLLAAAGLMTASCSSDEPMMGGGAADGNVTFAIQLPGSGPESRAISDGLSADELTIAVYKLNTSDNTYSLLYVEPKGQVFENKVANVQIPLVNGVTYRIAFFAKEPSAPYTITDDGKLTVDYSAAEANNDIYDAFYATADVAVSNSTMEQNVTLKRPFAQVNVGATDWTAAKKAGYVVEQTAMSFTAEVYTEMNLLDGTVDAPSEVTYSFAQLPDAVSSPELAPAQLTVADAEYDWVAMNYVLVGTDKEVVNTVTFTYQGPDQAYDIPVNAVPVQRNHRTNIVGRFFTQDVDYKIIIDEQFDEPDFDVDITDAAPVKVEVKYNPTYVAKGWDAAERIARAEELMAEIPNDFDNLTDIIQAYQHLFRNGTNAKYEKYNEGYKGTGAYEGSCGPFYYAAGYLNTNEKKEINSKIFESITITISGKVNIGSAPGLTIWPIDLYCPEINIVSGNVPGVISGCSGLNASIGGGYAQEFTPTASLNINGIHFTDIPGANPSIAFAVASYNGADHSIGDVTDTYINVENCVFDGRYYAYVHDDTTINRHFSMKNCTFNGEKTTSYILWLQQGPDMTKSAKGTIEITGCTFNNADEGINIEDRYGNVVTIGGNVFNGVGREGSRKHSSAIQMTKGTDFVVENNTFKNVLNNVFRIHDSGVEIENITINGNQFENCNYMLYIDPANYADLKINAQEQGTEGVAHPDGGQQKDGSELAHNVQFKK